MKWVKSDTSTWKPVKIRKGEIIECV